MAEEERPEEQAVQRVPDAPTGEPSGASLTAPRDDIELLVRRLLAQEMGTHVGFIDSHVKRVVWVASLFITLGAGLFVYFFGKTRADLQEYITGQVSSRYLDYRVDDKVASQLDRSIQQAVIGSVAASSTQALIRDHVSSAIRAHDLSLVPPGTIVAHGGERCPDGWIPCDGRALAIVDHAALFEAIGFAWGKKDDVTFCVPDLRGLFLRGVNGERHGLDGLEYLDPEVSERTSLVEGGNGGNKVGSYQADSTRAPREPFLTEGGSHIHSLKTLDKWPSKKTKRDVIGVATEMEPYEVSADMGLGRILMYDGGAHSHSISHGGDQETRPKNAYVHWIIKAQ